MFRLHHYDNLGTARFITFSCYHMSPFLQNDSACIIFLRILDTLRQKEQFKLLGYVLMPDHVHLVLLPKEDSAMGLLIGQLKGLVSKECLPQIQENKPAFWNKRCYDHNCRTPETVKEKIVYCHNNPVKRGLVSDSGDWKWSSYSWYLGKQDVPIAVDGIAL